MSFGWTAARDGNQVRFLLAVQLALPARPWLVIDGVLNSFLDEPLPHSGNGGGVDQKHTGYLTVPKSFICFEQRQRPLDSADGRLATAGNLIEMAPFRFTQLDFILDGSHVWALPHRKIIPKYDCLLILLQIYLEMVLVDGIKYQRLGDEHYYAQELFENEDLTGYLKNMLDATKSVYKQVVYEWGIEASFADELEKHTAVKVYAKLPGWFEVPTPLGNYNPDWAVLINSDDGEHLYFVVETKSSPFASDLRSSEAGKIECGRGALQRTEVREIHRPVMR